MDDLYETTTVALAKDEVHIYRLACREFGVDPEARLSGRQLETSPFHQSQLCVMFSLLSAERRDGAHEDLDDATAILADLIRKTSSKMKADGLGETLVEFNELVEQDGNMVDQAMDGELRGALEPRYPLDDER